MKIQFRIFYAIFVIFFIKINIFIKKFQSNSDHVLVISDIIHELFKLDDKLPDIEKLDDFENWTTVTSNFVLFQKCLQIRTKG